MVARQLRRDGRRVRTTTELGQRGERIAARYLTDHGLRLLDRNWRCRDGELDIVAREGEALVFCEGRGRGGAARTRTPGRAATHSQRSDP